jgi:hypothetical protein
VREDVIQHGAGLVHREKHQQADGNNAVVIAVEDIVF